MITIMDTSLIAGNGYSRKKWEYGYHEKEDFICISKDGTLGSIVKIENLLIGLPKKPSNNSILFNRKNKESQKWERPEPPKGLRRETEDLHIDYIDREYNRRENGVWFYNNGEPTYITGAHYFYLTHSKIDVGYPEYREINKWFFWFWEACFADERCYGMCYLKNRRSGFSYMAASVAVNMGTIYRNRHVGIVSKSGEDARSFFRNKVGLMFRKLISPFIPLMDGTTNPKESLNFTEPAQRITKNKKYIEDTDGLETIIDYRTTSLNSYDSEKIAPVFVIDEAGKFPTDCKINSYWEVAKTCLEVGIDIVGKAMMGSTSNKMKKGGKEFKEIYENSDVLNRDDNGQTISGLYSLFINAEYNLEGFFDEYGRSVVEDPTEPILSNKGKLIKIGSRKFLNNRRHGKKSDANAYNEELRKYPITVREAFTDELSECVFNLQKIEEQAMYNDTLPNNTIIRGNFSWTNGVMDSKVVWNPDNKAGRFNIVWMPKPEMQSILNNRRTPPHGWLGVGGVDSYDIDQTAYGSGSKGSLHLYVKNNPYNDAASHMFVLEYVNRPKTVDIFYEDVLMAAVFYGFPLLVESAKYSIVHYFNRRGYGNYLMSRPYQSFNPAVKPSESERKKKGLPVSGESIRQLDMKLESYIEDYVGYNEKGEIGRLFFNETLKQLKEYDNGNREKSDAVVSAGHALYAAETDIRKQETSSRRTKPIFTQFKM